MSIQLKIKHKTLATEARYIRQYEREQLAYARHCDRTNHLTSVPSRRLYNSLRDHRRDVVRPEARLTGIARAFIKGTPYRRVEQPSRKPLIHSDLTRIASMVARYHDKDVTAKKIEDWTLKGR